jgi:hypothetical protein
MISLEIDFMSDKLVNTHSEPIFLVGAPRSGTTLLQYMMGSHPNVSIPTGESHFMIPIYRDREKFGNLKEKYDVRKVLEAMYSINPEFLDTDLQGLRFDINSLSNDLWSSGCDTIPKIFNELYSMNARGEGKLRWGDKTPYYVLHMKTLKEMFPDAKFIHIIRDGRDAALSMLRRKNDLKIFNIYHAAKIWKRFVQEGATTGKELGSDVYFEFRFEDLLLDPEFVVHDICRFIKEPYTDSIINYNPAKDPHGKTPLLKGPIDKSNCNKWKSQMKKTHIRIFEGVAGKTLSQCGYELMNSNKSVPFVKSFLYRAHIRASFSLKKKKQ